jgi:hypothetical protein
VIVLRAAALAVIVPLCVSQRRRAVDANDDSETTRHHQLIPVEDLSARSSPNRPPPVETARTSKRGSSPMVANNQDLRCLAQLV